MNGGQGAPTYPLVVPQIRRDYYKAMGYPAVNSWDDLLTVLSDMQKKYPKTADGKKTYGMSFFTDWGDFALMYGQMMLGTEPVLGTSMSVDLDDQGKLLPNITDKNSTYWMMAKIFNKAKQMVLYAMQFDIKSDKNSVSKMRGGGKKIKPMLLLTTIVTGTFIIMALV